MADNDINTSGLEDLNISSESIENLGKAASSLGIIKGILNDIAGNPLFAGGGAVYAVKRIADEWDKFKGKSKGADDQLKSVSKTIKDQSSNLSEYSKMLQGNSTYMYTNTNVTKNYSSVVDEASAATKDVSGETEALSSTMLKSANPYIFAGATILSLINKYQNLRKELALNTVDLYKYIGATKDVSQDANSILFKSLDVQMEYGDNVSKQFTESAKELESRLKESGAVEENTLEKRTELYKKIGLVSGITGVNFAKATKAIYENFRQYNISGTQAFGATDLLRRAWDAGLTPAGDLNEVLQLQIELMDQGSKNGLSFMDSLNQSSLAMDRFKTMGLTATQALKTLNLQTQAGALGDAGLQKRIGIMTSMAIAKIDMKSPEIQKIFQGIDLKKHSMPEALFLLSAGPDGARRISQLQSLVAQQVTGLKSGEFKGLTDAQISQRTQGVVEKLSPAGESIKAGLVAQGMDLGDLANMVKLATAEEEKTVGIKKLEGMSSLNYTEELKKIKSSLPEFGGILDEQGRKLVTTMDQLGAAFSKLELKVTDAVNRYDTNLNATQQLLISRGIPGSGTGDSNFPNLNPAQRQELPVKVENHIHLHGGLDGIIDQINYNKTTTSDTLH